jgi:23S rRNA (uracil1939-C5)-methyltransferase
VLGKNFRILHGTGTVEQQIGHIKYKLSASSFFQVNTLQAKVLYDKAIELGGFTGTETIVDAHCGAGGTALYTAKHVKMVYGIEAVAETVADAKVNALLNGITNVEFICGLAEEVLPDMLGSGKEIDAIIFDPPRKGCDKKLLETIINSGIKKIIYISCEPSTLARDLKVLVEGGYKLVSASPVDMFPHTGKVECVVLLEKS